MPTIKEHLTDLPSPCLDRCPQIIDFEGSPNALARASRIGVVCVNGPITAESNNIEGKHIFTSCGSPWREKDINGNEIIHHDVETPPVVS